MSRIGVLALLAALALAGCGGDDTETVTKTETAQPTQGESTPAQTAAKPSAGNHGPRYFESPSHNIGCYVSAEAARCDIRERNWSPPPEPASCKKIGLDYGQGIAVGKTHAEFICAGDTTLGGPAILGYGESSRRGPILCKSSQKGITCSNTENGHGFFMSRQLYRIF